LNPTETNVDPLVFRSRIDPLLVALIVIPIVGVAAVVVQQGVSRGESPNIMVFVSLAASLGVFAWLAATTSYRFTDQELVVRSGPLRYRVPLAKIRRVTRSRSLLSAPAMSMRRLEIAYNTHDTVLISPNDEAEFLATLKRKAPHAELPAAG
jgi:hypothetical protein